MITAIRHTGIVVRDIVAMRRFYIALGFQLNQTATESGQFIEQVTGVEKAKINWVKLRAADGNLLELLEYDGHDQKALVQKQSSDELGVSHIAFSVSDIQKFSELVIANGGSVVNTPAIAPNSQVKVCYCHDIEGNLFEAVEIL